MKIETNTGIWKISPGEEGTGWEDCRKNGTIGIGWAHYTDLHDYTEQEIEEYTENEGFEKPGYVANQLIKFIFQIKKGHIIVAYSSPSTIYGIGIVEQKNWRFNENVSGKDYWLRNTRKVNWIEFSKIKIKYKKIISELGVRQSVKAIPKQFFIDEILPLIPKESNPNIYESIIRSEISQNIFPSIEEDEQSIFDLSYEEKKKLRFHKSFERNQKLSKEAKKIHGYTCMACGFNYEEKYGEIGEDYIEAHHLIPFAELNENTDLSPKKDVVVLCANCHRMIHRFEDTSNINKFKKLIK